MHSMPLIYIYDAVNTQISPDITILAYNSATAEISPCAIKPTSARSVHLPSSLQYVWSSTGDVPSGVNHGGTQIGSAQDSQDTQDKQGDVLIQPVINDAETAAAEHGQQPTNKTPADSGGVIIGTSAGGVSTITSSSSGRQQTGMDNNCWVNFNMTHTDNHCKVCIIRMLCRHHRPRKFR